VRLEMLASHEYCRPRDDPIRFYNFPVIGRMYRNRVARCIALLPPGRKVLEVGYGSGVSFLALAAKFDEIHGIDLHEHAEQVAHTFRHRDLRLHLRAGNVLDLPYPDASFDAALAVSIHEHLHIHEQARAFAEIRRVLKPDGCYAVGVPGMNPLMNAALYMLGYRLRDYHFSSERQVLEAMSAVFQIDATHYSPSLWTKLWTTYLCIRGRKSVPGGRRPGRPCSSPARSGPPGRGSG